MLVSSFRDSPPALRRKAKWPLPIQNHSKWLAGTWERTTPARNDQITWMFKTEKAGNHDRMAWPKLKAQTLDAFHIVSSCFNMFQHVSPNMFQHHQVAPQVTSREPGKNGDELCPSPKSTSPCERASQSMPLQNPVMLGPKGSPYVG